MIRLIVDLDLRLVPARHATTSTGQRDSASAWLPRHHHRTDHPGPEASADGVRPAWAVSDPAAEQPRTEDAALLGEGDAVAPGVLSGVQGLVRPVHRGPNARRQEVLIRGGGHVDADADGDRGQVLLHAATEPFGDPLRLVRRDAAQHEELLAAQPDQAQRVA